MSITLARLASTIGGTLVGGDPSRLLAGAATLETAGVDDVTLVDAADKLHLLAKSRAAAVIVPTGTGATDRPSIEVADVHAAFAVAIRRFTSRRGLESAAMTACIPYIQTASGRRSAGESGR